MLADVATGFGFSREEALSAIRDPQELRETEQLARSAAGSGISGVPFFIFDNRFAVSGAQPQEVFARAFAAALQPDDASASTA